MLAPNIADQPSPTADLEHPFAIIASDHCKKMFQIGDRRLPIAYLGTRLPPKICNAELSDATTSNSPQKRTMSVDTENELRIRLEEAEDILRAIRTGEVDALVVGDQIYTLASADAASNRVRGEMLAQVNDAIVAVDNNDRIIFLNAAAERQ